MTTSEYPSDPGKPKPPDLMRLVHDRSTFIDSHSKALLKCWCGELVVSVKAEEVPDDHHSKFVRQGKVVGACLGGLIA